MPDDTPVIEPTAAIDMLTQWIDSVAWAYTPDFAAALARLNAACARHVPPEPTATDDVVTSATAGARA
jgi:hypothetical protein